MRGNKRATSLKRGRSSKRNPAKSSRAKHHKTSPIKLLHQLWVKHPPTGEWSVTDMKRLPSGYVTRKDCSSVEDALQHEMLEIHTNEFRKTGAPLAGIKAFVGAHRRGLYPDIFVLEWLTQIFEKYGEDQGKTSLDDLLGIRQEDRRKPDAFSKSKEQQRDEILCLHMCILIHGFKLGPKEAAPAVAAAFKDRFDGIQSLAESSIAQNFMRPKWKPYRERYAKSPIHERWSDKDKQSYLQQYPLSALPRWLHDYIT